MPRDSAYPNRRMLLAGLGATAAGVAAAASPTLSLRTAGEARGRQASWWDRTVSSLKSAGLFEWSAAVGETFTFETVNGSHRLRLVAVTAFPASGSRPQALGRSQAFSAEFEPVSGPALPASDGLYQLAHRTYPLLPIYMGAPSTLGQKTRLAAVFN